MTLLWGQRSLATIPQVRLRTNFVSRSPVQKRIQIFPIGTFPHRVPAIFEALLFYETHAVCDLLGAGDLEALPSFQHTHKFGCLCQALGCAGVEPGEAAAHDLDVEAASFEIFA